MSDRQYHHDREQQCRAMAEKAKAVTVKDRHSALADLHHRLAMEEEEEEQGAAGPDTTAH